MVRLFQNTVLVIVSVVVALILGEAVLRLFPKPSVENWGTALFCKDDVVRRKMIPNTTGRQLGEVDNVVVQSNAYGYRDEAWETKTSPAKIMLLGDSFTFGWGVRYEQSIGFLLNQPDDVAVYNLGIPGDSLNDFVKRYFVYKQHIQPSLILIILYINDFLLEYDGIDVHALRTSIPEQYSPTCNVYPKTIRDWLNTSYLYALVNKYRASAGISFSSVERQKRLIRMGFRRDLSYLVDKGARMRSAFQLLENFLDTLEQEGEEVVLAYIPPAYVVDERVREKLQWAFGENVEIGDASVVSDMLNQLTERRRVPFVNLHEKFPLRSEPLYLERDSHLNERGHQVMAEEILPVILKHQ